MKVTLRVLAVLFCLATALFAGFGIYKSIGPPWDGIWSFLFGYFVVVRVILNEPIVPE